MKSRLFLDTSFLQALLNRRDQHHGRARTLWPMVRSADEVWLTEAVLVEVGNALSAYNREGAARFIEGCYQTENLHVVSVDTPLFVRALSLYREYHDKRWGLTDCISFVVMQDHALQVAVTTDDHFVQAGFRALMREEPT